MWKKLKRQLFGPIHVTDDNKPVRHIWIGNDEMSILINRNTNRIFASLWNDGYGKTYPTVFVGPLGLLRVYATQPVVIFSLRTFPYCALDLIRFKYPIEDVQSWITEYLIELKLL